MRRLALVLLLCGLVVSGCAPQSQLTFQKVIQQSRTNSFEDGLRAVMRTDNGLLRLVDSRPSFADPDGELGIVEVVESSGLVQTRLPLVEGLPAASGSSTYATYLSRPNGTTGEGKLQFNVLDLDDGRIIFSEEVDEGASLGGVFEDEAFVNLGDGRVMRWAPTDTFEPVNGGPEEGVLQGVSRELMVWHVGTTIVVTGRDLVVSYEVTDALTGSLDVTETYLLTRHTDGSWWVSNLETERDREVFPGIHHEPVVASWLPSGRLLGQTEGKAASCLPNGTRCFAPDPLTSGEEFGPAPDLDGPSGVEE